MKLIKAVGYYKNNICETKIYTNGIYLNLQKYVFFEIRTVFNHMRSEYYACIETTEDGEPGYNRIWIIAVYDNKDDADDKISYLCNELFRTNIVIG